MRLLHAIRAFRREVIEPLTADAVAWQNAGFASPRGGACSKLTLAFRFGGFRATLLHRVAYWAHIHQLPGVPMAIQAINLMLHGIELTPSTPIGTGLYLPHTAGTVITATSIGRNVELQGGITIGTRNRNGFPTVGDGVVVGCGGRILGPIAVGHNSKVGANAVVLSDVAPGCTVVGAPARPVRIRV